MSYICLLQLSGTAGEAGALDAIARRYRLENGNSLGEKDEVKVILNTNKIYTLCK